MQQFETAARSDSGGGVAGVKVIRTALVFCVKYLGLNQE